MFKINNSGQPTLLLKGKKTTNRRLNLEHVKFICLRFIDTWCVGSIQTMVYAHEHSILIVWQYIAIYMYIYINLSKVVVRHDETSSIYSIELGCFDAVSQSEATLYSIFVPCLSACIHQSKPYRLCGGNLLFSSSLYNRQQYRTDQFRSNQRPSQYAPPAHNLFTLNYILHLSTCEWVVPLFWKMGCLKFNFIYHFF